MLIFTILLFLKPFVWKLSIQVSCEDKHALKQKEAVARYKVVFESNLKVAVSTLKNKVKIPNLRWKIADYYMYMYIF